MADYVEFCCLLAPDGAFSPAEAEADRTREEEFAPSIESVRDKAETVVRLAVGAPSEDPAYAAVLALGTDTEAPLPTPLPGTTDEEEAVLGADVRAVLTQDVIQHLLYRAQAFGDTYPFSVDPLTGSLRVRALGRPLRPVYVFLLAASNLRNFDKAASDRLTRSFERLSVPVLRAHLPGAEVHLFGTAGDGGTGR